MTKLLPLALHTACAAAISLMATSAGAQTSPPGRTTFDQSGCRSCHAYSSRRGAPSVRDLLSTFEGDPEKALKGIDQNEKHAPDLMSGKISEKDLRAMAEWISGAAFPEPEEATPAPTAAAPSAPLIVAPSIARPPEPSAPVAAAIPPPPAAQVVARSTPPSPPALPRIPAIGKVTRMTVEPGKKTDLLIIQFSGQEADGLDMKNVDGKLIISLPGIALAEGVPLAIAGAKSAKAVGSVDSSDDNGTLVVTVAARTGDIKYSAIQAKSRLAIELSSVPAKKKPAPPTAVATLAPPIAASAKAPGKTAPQEKAPIQKAAPVSKATPTAPTLLPPAIKPEPAAKIAQADDSNKVKQEAKAKQDADAKAKKDAETQALAKKDAETKATQANAKKESDAKAKQESAEAGKKEAEMLASLKASAEALKSGGMSGMTGGTSEGGGKKDRSKLKAPDKFRDEPCPPIASSDPIGSVDETRAKAIIERVGCPQCHAFVQKKTGPPFKKVFEKVKGNPSCVIQKLKKNKEHNEEGVTDDLKAPEFKIVADYLATRVK